MFASGHTAGKKKSGGNICTHRGSNQIFLLSDIDFKITEVVFFLSFFLREREKERETEYEQGRGRERGRHRIRSRLQAPSCQHRA